jgi:hypothetical protein
MKHLKKIFESRLSEDIKEYFYEFTDKFAYVKFEVLEKEPDRLSALPYFVVYIAIEEKYWSSNRSKISESLNDCIIHLIKSMDLVKIDNDNYFDILSTQHYNRCACRIIEKKFRTR